MPKASRSSALWVVCIAVAICLILLWEKLPPNISKDCIPASYSKEFIESVNLYRSRASVKPIELSCHLQETAQAFAEQIAEADEFSYEVDGIALAERVKHLPTIQIVAEDIAAGYSTPSNVVDAWMQSAANRDQLTASDFNVAGFGKAGDRPFWTVHLGKVALSW